MAAAQQTGYFPKATKPIILYISVLLKYTISIKKMPIKSLMHCALKLDAYRRIKYISSKLYTRWAIILSVKFVQVTIAVEIDDILGIIFLELAGGLIHA